MAEYDESTTDKRGWGMYLGSFFGIGNDVAMQAVAVGFIIGVVQDSVETALNSSGDVFFTATAEEFDRKKKGE